MEGTTEVDSRSLGVVDLANEDRGCGYISELLSNSFCVSLPGNWSFACSTAEMNFICIYIFRDCPEISHYSKTINHRISKTVEKKTVMITIWIISKFEALGISIYKETEFTGSQNLLSLRDLVRHWAGTSASILVSDLHIILLIN